MGTKRMRWGTPLVLVTALLSQWPLMFGQSAPILLNFQGRLTNTVGAPITATTSVQFTLLRGGTADEAVSTGTIVYQEDASVTPDSNGVFTHVIGTGTPLGTETLVAEDFDTSGIDLFIEMSVAGEILLPRTQVLSTPYAIESSHLGGFTAQAIIGQAGGNAFANAVVRNGAGIEWLSISQITVKPGTLGFSDGIVRRTTVSLTWDFANPAGPLGLDTGTEAANTWYYLYAIPDPIDDSMFSAVASVNTPAQIGGLGPTGFGINRFLGSFLNDSGSNIAQFFRTGDIVSWGGRRVNWISISGTSLPNVDTWNPVDASSTMPETSRSVIVNGYYDSCTNSGGRFLLGPGTGTPPRFTFFCTDFGISATTCEATIPTINRTFSWNFAQFTSAGACHWVDFTYIGYIESLREF